MAPHIATHRQYTMSASSPTRSPILGLVLNSRSKDRPNSVGSRRIGVGGGSQLSSAQSNGDDDARSETSTVEWDQECFETFQLKVKGLSKQLWPKAANIEVERMHGGNFNRVIGITVRPSILKRGRFSRFCSSIKTLIRRLLRMKALPKLVNPATAITMRYVLRIPRAFNAQVDCESAFINFIGANTFVPVPRIIAFDNTEDNVLGEPFAIQERLPGSSLAYIYGDLNIRQKVSIAKQLGNIWLETQRNVYNQAGEISPENSKDILRFPADSIYSTKDGSREPVAQEYNASYWFFDLCKRRRDLRPDHFHKPWLKFVEMVDAIDEATGIFRDHDGFTISHGDFEARNILVEVIDNENVKITGIVDWDGAVIGPKVLSCAPPSWLWRWEDYFEDEDQGLIEHNANIVPEDPDLLQIKKTFEETVGPDFIKLGYSEEARLMRKLIRFAIRGLDEQWLAIEAVQCLVAWHTKRGTMDEEMVKIADFWERDMKKVVRPVADEACDVEGSAHAGDRQTHHEH